MGAQRTVVACPRSHSWCVAELGPKPRAVWLASPLFVLCQTKIKPSKDLQNSANCKVKKIPFNRGQRKGLHWCQKYYLYKQRDGQIWLDHFEKT